MRIAGLSARPPAADDVAGALEQAVSLLGQRPAITALGADGRREQGFASLSGWVAKGANLLDGELGLGPGDRLGLAGPPGWPLAAVALAAWWVGVTVVPVIARPGPAPDLQVLHASLAVDGSAPAGDHFWFGDALDGTDPGPVGSGEQWTDAVTPHGDRPPTPARDGASIALERPDGEALSQRDLLAGFATDQDGPLGLVRTGATDVLAHPDGDRLLAALALRPLVTGMSTVVVDAADPERDAHAQAERIARWFGSLAGGV
jgi:hypothetical protein